MLAPWSELAKETRVWNRVHWPPLEGIFNQVCGCLESLQGGGQKSHDGNHNDARKVPVVFYMHNAWFWSHLDFFDPFMTVDALAL